MSVGTSCVTQDVLPSISDTLVFPVKRFWIRPQSVTLPSTQNRDSSYSREPTDVSGTFEDSQLRLLKSRGTSFTRFYQDLVNLAHLKSLNLGLNRFLKAQDLMLVAINCRGLEELRLSRRRTNSEQHTLTDPDASFLFHNMRYSLTSLKFDAQGLGAETFQMYSMLALSSLCVSKMCDISISEVCRCANVLRKCASPDAQIASSVTFTDLPTEILLHIFSYFTVKQLSLQVAPVCHAWYSIAHDAALWVELVFTKQYVHTEEVQRLLRKSPRLRVLRLTERTDASIILSEVFRSNNKLEVLEVKRCSGRLAESLMNRLIFNCPLLRILAFKDSQFHSRSFFVLLHRLPLLTSINLGYNHYFELEDLVCIANVCEQVSEIKILSSRMFFNRELSECNNIFIKVCDTLKERLCVLKFNTMGLSDEGFKAIAECYKLKSLHIHNALQMTDSGLSALSKLHGLKSLLVSKARHVTSEGWKNLFDKGHFIDMESLLLTRNEGLDDICLFFVSTTCPRLRRLSLRSCMGVSDEGVEYLIHSCRRLVYLNIDGTHPSVGLSLLQIPR